MGGSNQLVAQCTVTSSNGWTAKFTVTPISVIPEFSNCPWYYHYELRYSLKVEFSGSTSNRSISCNLYFNCTGGTGNQPYNNGGTFTTNTTTTLQTNNNARQYTALSSYNYGGNPNCNQVTLAHINCSTFRIDYWGNGVPNGSIICNVGTPLPISLLHFDAVKNDQQINLNWVTASETNNDFFTIQRSKNADQFEDIATLKGAGNSTNQLSYSTVDKNAPLGIVYYRLKQTDFNGDYSYSKIVAIRNINQDNIAHILPNPGHDNIAINFNCSENSICNLNIFDPKGKLIKEIEIKSSKGENVQSLDISDLQKGFYIFRLNRNQEEIFTSQFVKM